MSDLFDTAQQIVTLADAEADVTQAVFDYTEAGKPRSAFAEVLHSKFEELVAAGKATNLKTAETGGRRNIYNVNPFLLYIDPELNSRDMALAANQHHVIGLAHLIAKRGVTTPLTVQGIGGRFLVVDGHCRYLAVMHAINVLGAEIKSVPIITEENKFQSEAERLALQIVRNSGKPLAPMEAAKAVSRMRGHGWTETQIADRTGLSRSRVMQLLDLADGVTPVVASLITKGVVTPTTVQVVLKETQSADETEAVLTRAAEKVAAAGGKRVMPKHLKGDLEKSKHESPSAKTVPVPTEENVGTPRAAAEDTAPKVQKVTGARRTEAVVPEAEPMAAIEKIRSLVREAATVDGVIDGDPVVQVTFSQEAFSRLLALLD